MTGRLVLLRHGETEWSRDGRHTSTTDIPLTDRGEVEGRRAGEALRRWRFAEVVSSPRRRALQTAKLAGVTVTRIDEDAREWDYGEVEGRRTGEVNAERAERGQPSWELFRDGCPGGESPEQVGSRVDRLLAGLRPALAAGDAAVIAHGHISRVIGARWVGQPAGFGAALAYDTARVCVLAHHNGRPWLRLWNADPFDPELGAH